MMAFTNDHGPRQGLLRDIAWNMLGRDRAEEPTMS